MPDPVTGIVAGTAVIGGIAQGKSASKAAKVQAESNAAGIAEERRQFDAMQKLLQPYTSAGPVALQEMMSLIGLPAPAQGSTSAATPGYAGAFVTYDPQRGFVFNQGGFDPVSGTYGNAPGYVPQVQQPQMTTAERQQQAIEGQAQNPLFLALAQQGEDAILQNASATGGLRGGNTQGALARFRPQLLNQFIEQQYSRLSDITRMGQQSAAGVGASGLQISSNIADRLSATGEAQAAGIGAQGQIFADSIGTIGGALADALKPKAGGGF